MLFLVVLVIIDAALLALVLTGHLEATETLVRSYVIGVAGTGSAVILGRAGEGAAAAAQPDGAWWQSQKVAVFVLVLLILTGTLLSLVLTGHLQVNEGLVRDYVLGVAGTGSAVVVGRAGEGIAAALAARRGVGK
jgi:hypothetical protein